tara:strand:+ start:136 stop:696 length:561 start_codon:yes stop_codon:yes gene_type:complete
MFRKIKQWPAACLRADNLEVENVSEVKDIIRDLIDTCNVKMGAGLAAPQIGINKKIVIIKPAAFGQENPDPSEYNEKYMVIINPTLENSGDEIKWKESCLSLEGITSSVLRQSQTMLTYTDEAGDTQKMVADWPFSGGLQHECDHLDGKLFIHHMKRNKRSFLLERRRKKLKKIARAEKKAKRALK